MNNAARLFSDYLNQKNINYSVVDANVICVNCVGKNFPSMDIHFHFSDDGRDVAVRSYNITRVQREDGKKHLSALITCSELNKIYRWVKFYLNDNYEFTAEDDAVIDPYTTGEECYKLLKHMANIIDEAYPTIMKMVWGVD